MRALFRRVSAAQIILLGFAAAILLGSLLLTLPFAARGGQAVSFADALFTATSAVCVTGLVVCDTATAWSPFGQAVILLLIQIGGMGVVTFGVAITALAGGRIGLKQRSVMQESISAPQMGGIVRMTGFILRLTAVFEGVGALLLWPVFGRDFGALKGLWYSVFHAVSAFCNAGFDLMGSRAPYSSLTAYRASPLLNLTVIALIVVGGIGFSVWEDVKSNGLRLRRYRLHSKVALLTSAVLLLLPALYFFFFELRAAPVGERLLSSLFQSATARTAGFNTVDIAAFSEAGRALMIALMLVGGSPGSTAGGMKTTTLAALLATALSVFRRQTQPRCLGRRLGEEDVQSAAAVVTLYLFLFLGVGCVISRVERLPLLDCLFEAASAVGTVGISAGVTARAGALSRGLLIALMYLGRVGGLTLLFAALSGKRDNARLPQEKLFIG